MPKWSNHVPDSATKYGFDLRRTPPDRPLVAIIISPDLLGCFTHYWGGRTIPCEALAPDEDPAGIGHECPACAEQMPGRWHAYTACYDPRTHETFIFETTGKAAQALETYRDSFGTLRGCLFQATRPKRRKNAKVEIATKTADLTNITLPNTIDIIRAMSVIWQIPTTAITTPSAEHSTPTVNTVSKTLNRMRSNLDFPDPPDPHTLANVLADLPNQLEPSNGKKAK
jgi:hypothetical protein